MAHIADLFQPQLPFHDLKAQNDILQVALQLGVPDGIQVLPKSGHFRNRIQAQVTAAGERRENHPFWVCRSQCSQRADPGGGGLFWSWWLQQREQRPVPLSQLGLNYSPRSSLPHLTPTGQRENYPEQLIFSNDFTFLQFISTIKSVVECQKMPLLSSLSTFTRPCTLLCVQATR